MCCVKKLSVMSTCMPAKHFHSGMFIISLPLIISLPNRASTLSNAVSSLANTGISFTRVDEREKQAALEEEQSRLKALKVRFSTTGLNF